MNALYRNQPALVHLFGAADEQYAMMTKSLTSKDFFRQAEANVERCLRVSKRNR